MNSCVQCQVWLARYMCQLVLSFIQHVVKPEKKPPKRNKASETRDTHYNYYITLHYITLHWPQ